MRLWITMKVSECMLVKQYIPPSSDTPYTRHITKCSGLPTSFELTNRLADQGWDVVSEYLEPANETQVCGFVVDSIRDSTYNNSGLCILPRAEVQCDGVSQCLTDECGCEGVFWCKDQVGCIAFQSLCDGVSDCRDGSDEFLCEAHGTISCWWNGTHKITMNSKAWCEGGGSVQEMCIPNNPVNCTEFSSSEKEESISRALQYCQKHVIPFLEMNNILKTTQMHPSNLFRIDITCRQVCPKIRPELCERLFVNVSDRNIIVNCKQPPILPTERVSISQICDGQIDCSTSFDEISCPGRIYCQDSFNEPIAWVPEKLKCNGYKNCKNGKDECGVCPNPYNISIVRLGELRVVAVFLTILLTYFNLKIILCRPTQYVGVMNFMVKQLAVYDLLMSVFLGATIIRKMEFCEQNVTDWRFAGSCKVLGVINSVSYHGSLISVVVMAAAHCYEIYKPGNSTSKFIIISIILGMSNLIHAIIPILSLNAIQETFRSELIFTDNIPFIQSQDRKRNLAQIVRLYRSYYGEKETVVARMIDKLRNITNKPGLFDHLNVPFYSFIPLCVHDMFGFNEEQVLYKIGYMLVIALLVLLLVTLLIIAMVTDVKPIPESDMELELHTKKVSLILIIVSQLLAWVPFLSLNIYYFVTKKPVPHKLYEYTAIILLPINAILNPMFARFSVAGVKKTLRNFFHPKTGMEITNNSCVQETEVESSVNYVTREILNIKH